MTLPFARFVAVLLLLLIPAAAWAEEGDWQVKIKTSEVTVKKKGETVCVIKTLSPKIEATRFLKWRGVECLAVKSKGDRTPAVLELFNAHSGVLIDRVNANSLTAGGPEWALPWRE